MQFKNLVDEGQNSTSWAFSGFSLLNQAQALVQCVKMITDTYKQIKGDTKIMPAFNNQHQHVIHTYYWNNHKTMFLYFILDNIVCAVVRLDDNFL